MPVYGIAAFFVKGRLRLEIGNGQLILAKWIRDGAMVACSTSALKQWGSNLAVAVIILALCFWTRHLTLIASLHPVV